MKSNDPNESLGCDSEAWKTAFSAGMHRIAILCDEKNQEESVHFEAFSSFIPRVGETIRLEDGTLCMVDEVIYHLMRHPKFLAMLPHVYAVKFAPKEESEDE